jgi:hypothetical protein
MDLKFDSQFKKIGIKIFKRGTLLKNINRKLLYPQFFVHQEATPSQYVKKKTKKQLRNFIFGNTHYNMDHIKLNFKKDKILWHPKIYSSEKENYFFISENTKKIRYFNFIYKDIHFFDPIYEKNKNTTLEKWLISEDRILHTMFSRRIMSRLMYDLKTFMGYKIGNSCVDSRCISFADLENPRLEILDNFVQINGDGELIDENYIALYNGAILTNTNKYKIIPKIYNDEIILYKNIRNKTYVNQVFTNYPLLFQRDNFDNKHENRLINFWKIKKGKNVKNYSTTKFELKKYELDKVEQKYIKYEKYKILL